MFNDLTTDNLEQTEDRIGGFTPYESDIYTGPVKAFYAGQSDKGAKFVAVILDMGQGKEYSETIYVTNRKGENFFLNKQDNTKKVPLPGFTLINDMSLVTCEKELAHLEWEDKVINLYDRDAGKQIPKSVPMCMEMIGKEVSLGITKNVESKRVKQGDEYVATGEERMTNSIDKVFHTASHMTVPEATHGAETATFWDKWLTANKGQVKDKRDKDAKSGNAGRPVKPGAAPSNEGTPTASPAKSLFNKG